MNGSDRMVRNDIVDMVKLVKGDGMDKQELHIEYVPVDDLKPYDKNARKHGDFDVDAIAESIRKFGFNDPIGVWGKDNLIVEGHGRLLASKKLGMKKVPIIHLDHLSDEQRRAYALAHNKTAENSEWDMEMLAEELESLNDAGLDLDMSSFGFDKAPEVEKTVDDIEEDEPPEPPETPVSTRGTIWVLGAHRLMCGDSTNAEDVAKLMDGAKADMVFTDPPYNVAGKSKNIAANVSKAMGDLAKADWDVDFNFASVQDRITDSIKEDATVYVCTSHFLAGQIWEWMSKWADFFFYCVWSKPNPMPSLMKRHWTWNTELICYATRGKHTFNFPKEGHALSTWTINKKNGDTGHPTEKPIEVPAMAVSHSSKENDVVLDLFGGSGSTLIACEQLNRICYTMEIDPHYVDVIVKRWETLTGKKAVKIA